MTPTESTSAPADATLNADDSDDANVAELEAAPAVVAVLATNNPGPWFEDCLTSLSVQDYPNLSVLVIDAASTEDISERVAQVLPNAFVRRLTDNPGYAAASNEVLGTVEGAALVLFCHDDVALDPSAVRFMVEEAYRSNAAIVAPKIVEWDEPDRLITVGGGADKVGVFLRNVEIGELDQGQHDAVREVFVAPGGCMLVRYDVFRAVGGFDEHMRFTGEDVDLCWRAQLLGARIVAMPAARVRHKLIGSRGKRIVKYVGGMPGSRRFRDQLREARAEASLRSVLKNYGRFRLLVTLPQLIIFGLFESIYGLFTGRLGLAQAFLGSWTRNIRNFKSLWPARKRVQMTRQITDRQIRRQQVSMRQRIATYWRSQHTYETAAKKKDSTSAFSVSRKLTVSVWIAIIALQLIAARSLIFGSLPEVGLIRAFSEKPTEILGMWSHPGRIGEISLATPSSVGLAAMSIFGVLMLNSISFTMHVLVAFAPLIGAIIMYVAARPLGVPAQLTATVVYALLPIAPNAIAEGNLPALFLYLALPAVIRLVMALAEAELFTGVSRKADLLRLSLLIAIGASFFVEFVPIAVVVILASAIGIFISGAWKSLPRLLARGGAALIVAAILTPVLGILLLAAHGGWNDFVTIRATSYPSLADFVSMNFGPYRMGIFGWMFVFSALFVLFVGRRTRLFAGTLLWTIALTAALLVETSARGLVPIHLSVNSLFAVYVVCLTFLVALGVRSFFDDLHKYQFGLRQILTVVSAGCLALSILPFLGTMFNGRWHSPTSSRFADLGWMQDVAKAQGPFRTVYIGPDEELPSRPWGITRYLSAAYSRNGLVGREGAYSGLPNSAASQINHELQALLDQKANRLEDKLTKSRVRYLVVVPSRQGREESAELVRALNQELELQRPLAGTATVVFENAGLKHSKQSLPENPAPLWNVVLLLLELSLWALTMYAIRWITPEGEMD